MNRCKQDQMLQKALAFALFLKSRLGRDCTLRNYTTNQIHVLTNIQASTIKKYLRILRQQGWVTFSGNNGQHLSISNLCSHTAKRNIVVDTFVWDSFKSVIRSIRAFIALAIQARKDFIRRTIQIATNPQKGQNFKAARKLVKRFVKQGILNGRYQWYKEYGLSLKRIAKEIGVCVRTAQYIMNFAVENEFVAKYHNFKQVCAKNVHFMDIGGYTFTTNNNMYVVKANLYVLNKDVAMSLSSQLVELDGKK